MTLNEKQLNLISQYSALEYSPRDIARILQIDEYEFLADWQDPDTDIRSYYDKGKLIQKGKVRQNIAKSAASSITAAQEYNKMVENEKIESLKTELDSSATKRKINNELPILSDYKDSLDHYHELKEWVFNNKDTEEMPAELQEYWHRLNTAHDLYMKLNNRSKGRKFIVNILRKKFPDISNPTAYRYIHEALNFFNVDMTREQWRNVLTEDLEKAKSLAWEMNRVDWFIKAVKEQAEIQQTKLPEPEKIDKELLQQRYLLIVNDPQLLGEGARSVNKDEILKRIQDYDLTAKDKKRLAKDAGIEDVEFEEIQEAIDDAEEEISE